MHRLLDLHPRVPGRGHGPRRPSTARRRCAERQGPITRPEPTTGWIPWSAITREALKPTRVSPFEGGWQTRDRPQPWQVWSTMVEPRRAAAGRAVSGSLSRQDRCRPLRRADRPGPLRRRLRGGGRGQPVPVRLRLDLHRARARRPAGAARSTSRSRSGRSSGSPPSTATPAAGRSAKVRREERVAIVGGGPAGMSAAYYLIRLGYGVTVFEAMPIPGGMMAIGIPEYRLPRETLQRRDRADRRAGRRPAARRGHGSRLHPERSRAGGLQGHLPGHRRPEEPAPRRARRRVARASCPATVFLKQVNLGERPRLSGPVIVVGGGSTAMDAARSALRSGAESVTVMYRRGFAEMPAQAEEVEAARAEGVAFRIGAVVTEVLAPDGATTGVRVVEQAPTATSRAAASVWAAVPGSEATIPAVDRPRRGRRGARSVDPARRRRHRGQRLRRDRRRPADALDRSRRRLRRWRRRVGSQDHHRRGRVRPTRRRRDPRVPRRAPRRRGGDHGHGPLPDPGRDEPDARPRAASAGTPAASRSTSQARSGPARSGFDQTTAMAEASRCFRCDAVYGCATVAVTTGRGPADGPDRQRRPRRRHRRSAARHPPPTSTFPTAGGDR